MKKIKNLILFILVVMPSFMFCSCTAATAENLAKDLDSTVKNLVISVSTLDWPDDGDLENFNKIEHISSASQTSDIVIADTQIDTSEIYIWLENVHSKINILLSKRGDLLLYLNEMYGGNTNLSEKNLLSLNVYMNILKDNSNYLSSYNGMLKNQISQAKEIYASNSNVNLINAYLIKVVETLQVRCAKIDTSILAMTSIIDIIKANLVNNYFDYNKHDISTLDDSNEQLQKNTDNSDNENTPSEPLSEKNEDPIIEEPINNDQTDEQITNDENAINFDSEITEVQQTQPSVEDNIPNYDHLIKTLEEPIIDDNTEIQETTNIDIINESKNDDSAGFETTVEIENNMQKNIVKENTNFTTIDKNVNSDNDNTQKLFSNDIETEKLQNSVDSDAKIANNNNYNALLNDDYNNSEENSSVTREIIKENAV